MQNFLIRLVINAAALWVAAFIIGGINFAEDSIPNLLYTALIFGLINALIRPLLLFVTCPLQLFTLGTITLVINALMLWLTGRITGSGFTVDGFWAAFFGGIVISLVSMVLNKWVLPDTASDLEEDVIEVKPLK